MQRCVLSDFCRNSPTSYLVDSAFLPPLLLHTSSTAEAHFHRLTGNQSILLHEHLNAPFLSITKGDLPGTGTSLTIFSSGGCGVESIRMKLDWRHSFARYGARYWNAVLTWSAGIVGALAYLSLTSYDSGGKPVSECYVSKAILTSPPRPPPPPAGMPDPMQAFERLISLLPHRSFESILISLLPLPKEFWLGNSGEPYLVFVAPLILLMSSGLVFLSWFIILVWLNLYGKLVSRIVKYIFISSPWKLF